MKTKLFFSGSAKPNGALLSFCENAGWELTQQPLIRFEKLAFTLPEHFDVVFFSSPRSVDYFFSENEINSSYKIACLGSGTAAVIQAKSLIPNFVGKYSGKPEEVGKEFSQWLGTRTVLFPLAKHSNETVLKTISDNQKMVVRCYETILVEKTIDQHDIYMFTSPSNVISFLKSNTFPESSQLIAWGTTTASKMREFGLEPSVVLKESSESALVETLMNISTI
ncbi:MAG: uroporphyrinogen-III synthase [Fluviicola sp.]|nr:uroporphyrinogen-III synthase [Fluviicola sp.]